MNMADKVSACRRVSRTEPKRADRKGSILVPSVEVSSGNMTTASPACRAPEILLTVLLTCIRRFGQRSGRVPGAGRASGASATRIGRSRRPFATAASGARTRKNARCPRPIGRSRRPTPALPTGLSLTAGVHCFTSTSRVSGLTGSTPGRDCRAAPTKAIKSKAYRTPDRAVCTSQVHQCRAR